MDMGEDLPPETLYIIRDGGDYGWPRCHSGNIEDQAKGDRQCHEINSRSARPAKRKVGPTWMRVRCFEYIGLVGWVPLIASY
jgi:hypothetical protein